MIGAVYGIQVGNQAATVDILGQLLKCPSNDRNTEELSGWITGNYQGSYTYNTSLGDWRAMDPADAKYPTMNGWAYYKKRVNVPENVVVALDVSTNWHKDDNRFEDVGDLTTTGGSRPYPRGGTCHKGKANVLFFDGSVRVVLAYDPKPGANPISELQDWMIKAPDRFNEPVPQNRWTKWRGIPF
jgi:prepilin-type processing-associated H-X9-DG protein